MRFGFMEILLVGGIVLLVFGPGRFSLLGKSVKKSVEEYKDESEKKTKQ
ncbi:MAG: twin-arginine translocase TatA/TatE family subunit [Tindallia sp. MSAO_Bac2]|nr:MAG: twin-arginine translocase TatA/TatE family subunit [Tindallia sp. MSAO_Bac2]